MKYSMPRNPECSPEIDGVLYFAQRLEEMLFDYTIDLFRMPLLNTHGLTDEYCTVAKKVEKNEIREYQLNVVFEEFSASFKNDIVIKECWGQDNIDRIMKSFGSSSAQEKNDTIAYLNATFDNGKYYYIGNDGIMKTGWQQIDGQWYYLDQTGAMQIGWLKSDDGKWYFLYPNGAMAVNTVIDGRTIGEDGVWVPNEGDTEPANSMDLENGYLVQNLEGITKKDYTIIASGKTAAGSRWGNAIRLKGKGSYVQCNTNGEYRMLSGVFGPSSQFDSALLARVTVYGDDDQVLYTSPDIHYNEKNVYFGVDVSGQKQIRVEVSLLKDNEWDDPVILFDGLSLYK